MVWQETVNLPTYVTTGSIPVISTKFRSVRIEVITVDCLSTYRSSILLQTAKVLLYIIVCRAVAEWSKATVCKTVKSWVQIPPARPILKSRVTSVVRLLGS